VRIFELMDKEGHEQLLFCRERWTGLRLLIGIHDTTLGPALGGCRMWAYGDEAAAVIDVLRLSRGMTYKAAAAGVNYGGGKAVVWADPEHDKSEELLRALGRFVAGLRGRFITGTDVGTTADDFVWAQQETDSLVALPEAFGGSGDSSLTTAFGVYRGMQACVHHVYGEDALEGRTVAVQGLGKVGTHLCRYLHESGARLVVADLDPGRVRKVEEAYGARAVDPARIFGEEVDIFSPNALGAVINDQTIPLLRCRVVAGSANNQLLDPESHAAQLAARGILYAPDYVINAGGLIQVADELAGYNRERALRKTAAIYDLLLLVFARAQAAGITTTAAADELVRERLEAMGRLKRMHVVGSGE
jgi:leucine dehydrogenase